MGFARERQYSTDSVGSKGAPHIADVIFDLYQNPDSETLSLSGLLKVIARCQFEQEDSFHSKLWSRNRNADICLVYQFC